MSNTPLSHDIISKIKQLQKKYEATGQDMSSYLEGLLYGNYLKYWEYIHLDTLLSLQNPKTDFPDEEVFIIYHQITELYFKLILKELTFLQDAEEPNLEEFIHRLQRCNRYFKYLSNSFEIMTEGMEKEQFLKFRMALLPASGFQSAQFRFIEFRSTSIENLLFPEYKKHFNSDDNIEEVLEHVYWRKGATELASGKKTLTLRQFEDKYLADFCRLVKASASNNLWSRYQQDFASKNNPELINTMRNYDALVNIHWRLSHLKSAVKYLNKKPESIAATGGTNWQQYLPPHFQKVIFFPGLWSEKEKKEWGRVLFEEN